MRGEIQNAYTPKVPRAARLALLTRSLTPVEKVVLELYLKGRPYEEIRFCAGSKISVSGYLASIRRKAAVWELTVPYRHPAKRACGRKRGSKTAWALKSPGRPRKVS